MLKFILPLNFPLFYSWQLVQNSLFVLSFFFHQPWFFIKLGWIWYSGSSSWLHSHFAYILNYLFSFVCQM